MTDVTRDYQWKRYSDLRYRIELSILYHRKRGRFLYVLGKLGKGASVLSALHVAAAVLLSMVIPAVDAGRVLVEGFVWALCTAVIFCVAKDSSEYACTHKQLTRAYYALLMAMVAAGRDAFESATQLDRWEVQIYSIERGEPAVMTALIVLCENQIKIARGQPDKVVPLSWGQRTLAQLYDFPREAINGAA
ncbi:hypothetical protein [Paraburkholderia fungorum]|uniref:hypothetical protein n=1 Tax=Paraburkholderia fungorum TaxID=134537 RepID=UPI00402B47A7